MKKYILLTVLIVAVFIGGVAWWQFGAKETPQNENLNGLTFGWNVWPGTLPFLVA